MGLFEKLQNSQKKVQKSIKNKFNPNSSFATLTDNEIALVIALKAKELRKSQKKTQKQFSSQANLSSPTTYSNFEQKGTISMINFIKVIRAFGKLDELEKLLQPSTKERIEKMEESVQ
jgi:hypothetical protein